MCRTLETNFVHTNLRNSSFFSFLLHRRKNTPSSPRMLLLWLPPQNGCDFVEARGLLDSGLVSSEHAKLAHHAIPVAVIIITLGVFLRCSRRMRTADHPRVPVCSDGDLEWGGQHRWTAIPGAIDDTKGPNPKAEDNTAAVCSSSCGMCFRFCVLC